MKQGFTFPYGTKTVFVETTRERRNKSLAANILREMKLPDGRADELLYWLQKAECELKQLPNGANWYSLIGKGFSEFGPIEDLIIVHVI